MRCFRRSGFPGHWCFLKGTVLIAAQRGAVAMARCCPLRWESIVKILGIQGFYSPNFSKNTDAQVMIEERFFLKISVRLLSDQTDYGK